ncbi:MAG TPA: tetratricopeptide repeat protein [Coriobacteriia bacterium]|nr:tetratricopeptide repeat protein [Coriobacteriia bacterium]
MNGRSREIMLAEGLARQGHTASAIEAAYEAMRLDADEPLVHALLADLFLLLDCYDESITAAMRAIELDPSCSPAYLALGLAYDRRGGMWDRSVLVWHELAEVVPDLVTAHVQLGEALAASGFEDEAIDSWKRALSLDPREARAMYNLAIAALRSEGMSTALPGFRRAGELDPTQDEFFFWLAGMLEARRAQMPGTVSEREARLREAYALALEEDLFGAADLIREMLNDEPDDPEALALAGFCYIKQEAVDEAVSVALRGLAIDPRTPSAVYVLGVAFAKRPVLARNSLPVFGALAQAVPDHPMPCVLYAEALLGQQSYNEATAQYLRAVELDPTLVRARFGLAAALIAGGEHSLARHHMRRAGYHATRHQGLFERLYDDYVAGRE